MNMINSENKCYEDNIAEWCDATIMGEGRTISVHLVSSEQVSLKRYNLNGKKKIEPSCE